MSSVDKIFKLADRFARKISLAEKLAMPAQPGDIADALVAAGLLGKPDDLFPIADQLDLDASVNVATSINIDQNMNVTFSVVTSPALPAKATQFAAILKQKYGEPFKKACQTWWEKNKIIPAKATTTWHSFGPKKG
jgi:hypothetical protein